VPVRRVDRLTGATEVLDLPCGATQAVPPVAVRLDRDDRGHHVDEQTDLPADVPPLVPRRLVGTVLAGEDSVPRDSTEEVSVDPRLRVRHPSKGQH
jgi:hypothetical protein